MVRQIQKNPPKKIKERFSDGIGVVCIKVSFNNIIVTITDLKGEVVYWLSAGKYGWKGTRKRTAYAAEVVIDTAIEHCVEQYKMKKVIILIKVGVAGRYGFFNYFENSLKKKKITYRLKLLRDITGLPHNGCRPPNKRRT